MLLLLGLPISVRPQSIITNRPALTDRGHVEDLTYSNSTLGFSYQLPRGFFVIQPFENFPSDSLCLMAADKRNGTPWRDRILLVADTARHSWTISEYPDRLVHGFSAKGHIVVRHETYPLKIAGQNFFLIDFQKTDDGKTVYQVFACTRLKGSVVSWMFTSLDENRVREMATSINTVAFVSEKAP